MNLNEQLLYEPVGEPTDLWQPYLQWLHRPGRTASALLAETPEHPDWLVPGFIAKGWGVKIGAREKVGKGTLVYYLLSKLERGEPTVFGAACSRGVTAVILTEEPVESVREKIASFGLAYAHIIYGWEVADLDWEQKVTLLVKLAVEGGHELIFTDNLSRSAHVEDENGPELARAAERLLDTAREHGLSVLCDHHHKKGNDRIENKSRGGTALAGAMDVNVEMERVGGAMSRKRRITSLGRMRATIWQRTITLSDAGDDYSEIEETSEADPSTLVDLGTAADAHAAGLAADADLLRRAGAADADGFGKILGLTREQGRKRLVALEAAGLATHTTVGRKFIFTATDAAE